VKPLVGKVEFPEPVGAKRGQNVLGPGPAEGYRRRYGQLSAR